MPEQTDRDLAALCEAVVRARGLLEGVLERSARIAAEREQGRSYEDIVADEERPLVVELLTDVLDELAAAGSAFRRSEARALHAAGLSQEAIAELFGVSRQRVSVLLKR